MGNIEWQNTIGGNDEECLNSIQQTSDSGFVMGGMSSSPISGDKTEYSNYRDYFVVKVSQEWS